MRAAAPLRKKATPAVPRTREGGMWEARVYGAQAVQASERPIHSGASDVGGRPNGRGGVSQRPPRSSLPDELQGELHVAASILIGGDETRGDVGFSAPHDHVRVVEDVEGLGAELDVLCVVQPEVLGQAQVEVPEAGAPEVVPLRHVRWEGSEVRAP